MKTTWRMRILVMIIVCLTPIAAGAEIYTWTDDNGNVVFSDRPHPGAKQIKLPPVQTYTGTAPLKPASAVEKQRTKPTAFYQRLNIIKPADDEAIRRNNGNIDIELSLTPPLRTTLGDYFTLLLDGETIVPDTDKTRLTLYHVDRGTHTLQALVNDSNANKLLSSPSITFHLLRMSALHKKPTP